MDNEITRLRLIIKGMHDNRNSESVLKELYRMAMENTLSNGKPCPSCGCAPCVETE